MQDISDQPTTANHLWLMQMLQAQRQGQTCLPFHLGLSLAQYQVLMARHFSESPDEADSQTPQERDDLREDLLELRREEWQQLQSLLLSHRAGLDPDEVEMASIVAAACLGGDHLWRDLGLTSRQQLRELLFGNFPELAARNVNNMRWKKFFYKQLCEQEGGYVCRSPSCEQCPTYQECFGDEH